MREVVKQTYPTIAKREIGKTVNGKLEGPRVRKNVTAIRAEIYATGKKWRTLQAT